MDHGKSIFYDEYRESELASQPTPTACCLHAVLLSYCLYKRGDLEVAGRDGTGIAVVFFTDTRADSAQCRGA